MATNHKYTTAANMGKIIAQLTDSVNFDADEETELFINRIEAIVNTKLAKQYVVPLTGTIPLVITWIVEQLTAYDILNTEFTQDAVNNSEWLNKYKEANQLLTDLSEGKIPLIDDTGTEATVRTDNIITDRANREAIYDMDDDLNHNVDGDLLDDIAGDRNL